MEDEEDEECTRDIDGYSARARERESGEERDKDILREIDE